jgi:hypothetical protein
VPLVGRASCKGGEHDDYENSDQNTRESKVHKGLRSDNDLHVVHDPADVDREGWIGRPDPQELLVANRTPLGLTFKVAIDTYSCRNGLWSNAGAACQRAPALMS